VAVDGTGEGRLDEPTLAELRLALGDETFFEVAAEYVRDGERLLDELGKAVAADDTGTLRRSAHSLRSSSELIGATTLGVSCAAVERLALDGDSPAAGLRLPDLRALFEEAVVQLAEFGDRS
jgi:two-component system, sensor histidine kinase and response regulator